MNLNLLQKEKIRYIKLQPKITDLSVTFWGIARDFVGFVPQSLILRSVVLG